MQLQELINYLRNIPNDYYEYSFYNYSAEIMEAVLQNGIIGVLEIQESKEVQKGVFQCRSTWKLKDGSALAKKVSIDITGEMIFITEII